jgi:hypothetical protein
MNVLRLGIGLAALVLSAASATALAAERRETVQRSFALRDVDGRRTVVIDNVNGSVVVEPASGDRVEVTVEQRFEGRTAADIDLARREVVLEVEERAGELELVQGGSWRCRDRRRDEGGRRREHCCCDYDEKPYDVRFDWKVRVPKDADLDVRSVNSGAIRVSGVEGRLVVRHVNDDVTIERAGTKVDASTVNGELTVEFAAKPAEDCRFNTVNGDIDLAFPKGLGADLSFATMNGEVYTDFPFVLAKPKATSEHTTDGRRHRHSIGRTTAATIGDGGIGIDCSTINGSIYIRERS